MSARKVQTVTKAEKTEAIEAKSEKIVKAEKAEKVEKPEKATKAEKVVKAEKVQEEPKPEEKVSKKKVIPKEEEEIVSSTEEPVVEEETEEESIEDVIDKHFATLFELAARTKKYSETIVAEMKKLQKNYNIERKKNKKIISKSTSAKKQRSGSKGLDKLVKVKTADFRTFVEKNHQQLNDKNGNQILTTLIYDENDGSLMISRKVALKLLTSYAKQHELQKYEDRKRIKMDKTLQKLFPNHAERKADDGSVVEENFYFCSIMGALTDHLN